MSDSAESLEVNLTQYAALWGVSKATVDGWCKAGMPSRGGGKQGRSRMIVLAEALPWQLDQFRNRTYESQRERKAAVEADLLELKLGQETSQLMVDQDVEHTFAAAISALNANLLTDPGKRCREYAAESNPAVIRETMLKDARAIARRWWGTVSLMDPGGYRCGYGNAT